MLSSLALDSVDINKSLLRLKKQGSDLIDNFAVDNCINRFIDAWDIETQVTDEPFLTSVSFLALGIFCLSQSSDSQGLVGLDCDGFDKIDYLNLNLRGVDLRSELEPFVTSNVFGLTRGEISKCLKLQGAVAWDYRQLFASDKGFTWIEREGL